MPKISFVMPTKNRANRIEKSIESIINQSESNWELIVVDDHSDSKDKTEKIVDKFSDNRIKYIRMPEKWSGGIPNARNFGNQFATSPFIAVADSDDMSNRDRAKLTLDAFEKTDADVVFGKYFVFFELENKTVTSDIKIENFNPNQLRNKNLISNNSSAYKRELAYQYPYNSFFVMAEDYDFFSRLAKAGKKFYFINRELFTYVVHDSNISGGKSLPDFDNLIKLNRGWENLNRQETLNKIVKK